MPESSNLKKTITGAVIQDRMEMFQATSDANRRKFERIFVSHYLQFVNKLKVSIGFMDLLKIFI